MFETFEPSSFDSMKALLPSIGQVVTIEKCIYYLSLVEQIANLREQFSEHLDTLHARAEMRYEYWLDGCRKSIPGPQVAPPIDVAYIMHAHLVSPFRYYEDSIRLNLPMLPMPFEQIHVQQNQPNEASLEFWATCVPNSEPYLLTLDDLLGDIILQSPCHHCRSVLCITGYDYGYWRFHPSALLKCWNCHTETNMHHKAMLHLMNDIGNDKNFVRGIMLNSLGQLKQDSMQKDYHHIDADAYFGESYQGRQQQQHFHRGFKGVPKRFLAIFKNNNRPNTNSIKEFVQQYYSTGGKKKNENELMRTIQCTYGDTNPSPFSLDLLQAVERQHVVGTRMLNVQWMLPDAVVRGLRNYKEFLLLMKNDSGLIGVPTLEIDVSWHTHQCHPVDYRRFTLQYIRRVINHDDTIPQYRLDIYSKHTRMAWQRKINESRIKRYSLSWSKQKKSIDFGVDYVHGELQIEERIYSCCCHHQHHKNDKKENQGRIGNEDIIIEDTNSHMQDERITIRTKDPDNYGDNFNNGTINDSCSIKSHLSKTIQ